MPRSAHLVACFLSASPLSAASAGGGLGELGCQPPLYGTRYASPLADLVPLTLPVSNEPFAAATILPNGPLLPSGAMNSMLAYIHSSPARAMPSAAAGDSQPRRTIAM